MAIMQVILRSLLLYYFRLYSSRNKTASSLPCSSSPCIRTRSIYIYNYICRSTLPSWLGIMYLYLQIVLGLFLHIRFPTGGLPLAKNPPNQELLLKKCSKVYSCLWIAPKTLRATSPRVWVPLCKPIASTNLIGSFAIPWYKLRVNFAKRKVLNCLFFYLFLYQIQELFCKLSKFFLESSFSVLN